LSIAGAPDARVALSEGRDAAGSEKEKKIINAIE
jgi:hypothetical protein